MQVKKKKKKPVVNNKARAEEFADDFEFIHEVSETLQSRNNFIMNHEKMKVVNTVDYSNDYWSSSVTSDMYKPETVRYAICSYE